MPESPSEPNFAHFHFDPVADRLGEGPLSAVYRARDVKLERTVALKVLRAHVELDPEADQRFEREARHTSNLVHANIATIYEYGEWQGQRYIAMEYLQGRTLDRILRDQPLSAEECLRIALQVTSALELVHKNGLIHRDLKPANVMVLHDGTVKLLDFGIARARGEETITQHGMLVGTVLYMSPEQVRGEELDARSDIFALGAVLYHAVTGALPFPGQTFPEVCMAILDARPQPVSQVRPGVPQALEEFISSCLEADPARRYANAEVAHGALLAISDGLSLRRGPERSAQITGHIVLMPLRSDRSHADMAGSIRRDIASELSRAGLTTTLATESDAPPKANFVLRGEFQLQGELGRLFLTLEHSSDQDLTQTREIWRDSAESAELDEWTRQASLVSAAVRGIRRQLAEHPLRAPEAAKRRDVAGAKTKATEGHGFLHRGLTKHLLSAIARFRLAIELDSRCALAYAGLSEALVRKYLYYDGDESFLIESREQARRALAFEPNCAEAHTSLGFGYHLTGLSVDAQREYRLAMQLDHEEWLAHRLLGALLSREGNYKGASPLLQRAIALNPSYISSYDHLHSVLQRLDRYEESLEVADRGIAAARRRIAQVPDDQDSRLHLAMLLARMGQRDEALAEVAQALQVGPKDGFTACMCAQVHAALGNPDEALQFLATAQARGYYVRTELRSPEFEMLRGLPEFQKLG